MTPITRTLRNGAVTATAAAALLALTGTAALAGNGASAEVDVTHDCTAIDVTSTKAISNVVLLFADGDTQRFEGLGEIRTGTFAGTGEDNGEVITTAWIKSGNNKSGDGPGYGERFDFDTSACEDGSTTSSDAQQSTNVQQSTAVEHDSDEGKQDTSDRGTTSTTTKDDAPKDITPAAGANEQAPDDEPVDVIDAGDDQPDAVIDTSDVADDTDATNDQDDASAGAETPTTSVLGAVEQREAGTGLRAADASDVDSAGALPNTGADPTLPLAAALAALALGSGLLRRTSRSSA